MRMRGADQGGKLKDSPIKLKERLPGAVRLAVLIKSTGLVRRCLAAGICDIRLFAARGKAAFYKKRGFRERAVDAPGMSYVPNRDLKEGGL